MIDALIGSRSVEKMLAVRQIEVHDKVRDEVIGYWVAKRGRRREVHEMRNGQSTERTGKRREHADPSVTNQVVNVRGRSREIISEVAEVRPTNVCKARSRTPMLYQITRKRPVIQDGTEREGWKPAGEPVLTTTLWDMSTAAVTPCAAHARRAQTPHQLSIAGRVTASRHLVHQ